MIKKSISILCLILIIGLGLYIFFVFRKANVITKNNSYNLNGTLVETLIDDKLKEISDIQDNNNFEKNYKLYQIPYDIKIHLFGNIYNPSIYERYLMGYELKNGENNKLYVFFLMRKKSIQRKNINNEYPYKFVDAEEDGFYILVVGDSLIINMLKEKQKKSNNSNFELLLFENKEEINNKKVLKLLKYMENN
mgnify:FL=1